MNDKTRQQAQQENPQTQDPQGQQGEALEDAVSYFDEITNEDSKDSKGMSDEDRELDADREHDDGVGESETGKKEADGQQSSPLDDDTSGGQVVEELRRQKEKLEHSVRANSGRVSALTKKLNAAREQIRKLEQSRNLDDAMSTEELKALEEDFPEAARLARAYTDRIRRELHEQLRPIHEAVDTSFQSQQEQLRENELRALAQAHPDYQDIVAGDQEEQFRNWLDRQSAGVQALYQSSTADDAIALLDLYKRHAGIAAQTPSATARKRDLSEHAELPRKGASRAGAESDDPVEIFNSIT